MSSSALICVSDLSKMRMHMKHDVKAIKARIEYACGFGRAEAIVA